MSDIWTQLVAAHQASDGPATGVTPEHRPAAAILACSDARVAPSVLFDQPAGSLFIVRIAGNTASPTALASLDYAVEELGVGLVVVLGHSSCGAVTAASTGAYAGHLAPIVEPISALAATMPGIEIDELIALNVANTLQTLSRHDGPTGTASRAGEIELRGAVHDLRTGELELIEALAN